jgi:hypothetical protein
MTQDELLDELEEDGNTFFSGGFWNNIIDLTLTVLTVLASLVATVLATTDQTKIPRWWVAAVAAVPAALTALQRIIGIRERSQWYFLYAANVRALATRLKYANTPNLEDFANQYADLEIEMEKEWVRIGHTGAAGPSGRASARRRQSEK